MDASSNEKITDNKIFLSVDHLKVGTYELNILLGNKIIETVIINKHGL